MAGGPYLTTIHDVIGQSHGDPPNHMDTWDPCTVWGTSIPKTCSNLFTWDPPPNSHLLASRQLAFN